MAKLYYYNLIPLTNLPFGKQAFFTYSHEQKLEIGQLVIAYLRGRRQRSIVYQLVKSKPKFRIFKITEIVSDQIIINKNQFKLGEKIRRHYYASLGMVLNLMTPKITKRVTSGETKKHKLVLEKNYIVLNSEQKEALGAVINSKRLKFLLFGVTGSGKTEVYLRVIASLLEKDQTSQILVLVPEISLTPQAEERYSARFGQKISLWHSRMTRQEKWREWQRIKLNQVQIVIGPRSAIFAPWQNLKLIVIDEEHDSSFKQYDQSPRYDARTAAVWLSKIYKAKLILGSATPRVEDFYLAKKKEYKLLRLSRRVEVSSRAATKMPKVKIIDMREELKQGNFGIFSEELSQKMTLVLKKKGQVLLFINRRGLASFVMCRACGYVVKCRQCEVSLVYHKIQQTEALICHYCGLRQVPINKCPNCHSAYIKFFGLGTQKAEAEVKKFYPLTAVFRMDRDTTSRHGDHEKIYQKFKAGEIKVLIGTQMITKGWDLPQVALVGIIAADLGLFFPDFKASERVFNLLTQVAGRTGRGKQQGLVVMQTYQPDNYVIRTAAKHNYEAFWHKEILTRKELNYPPFSILVKLVFSHKQAWRAEKQARDLAKNLKQIRIKLKLEAEVLGPSPSFIPKLRGYWRWQIILRSKQRRAIDELLTKVPTDWKIDVEPEDLL